MPYLCVLCCAFFFTSFWVNVSSKHYSLQPTQIKCAEGSLNQIPPWVEISGDIRLTPFYNIADVTKAVNGYVVDLQVTHTRNTCITSMTRTHE